MCLTLSVALVVIVALQEPAVSVGLRWEQRSPSRAFAPVPVELMEPIELALDTQRERSWFRWLPWLLGGLLSTGVVVGVARWLLRRRVSLRPAQVSRVVLKSDVAPTVSARTVESGLVAALEILSAEGHAPNAIVRAWQRLEDAAASAGLHRHPSETPSEFTARILHRSHRSAAPIATLLSLYQRVRFGEHSPSATEITSAHDAVAMLVELWRSDLALMPRTRGTR